MKLAGVGEVTAAIVLTAAFAVAATTLYGVFQENLGVTESVMHTQTENSRHRAAEMIGIGPGHCGAGFLIYNYGQMIIQLDRITIYDHTGTTLSVSFQDLDGDMISSLHIGDAAWADTSAVPCGMDMVMVTPAGDLIRIEI